MGHVQFRGLITSSYLVRYSFLLATVKPDIRHGYKTIAKYNCGLRHYHKSCNIQSLLYPSLTTASILSGYSKSLRTMATHVKARGKNYARKNSKGEDVPRFVVPDDKVSWDVDFSDYQPVEFTAPSVASQPVWADVPDCSKVAEMTRAERYSVELGTKDRELSETVSSDIPFNVVDENTDVDRRCKNDKGGYIEIQVVDGRPRNHVGRTGVTGRGCLGRWGPNHAADPIVTRWKRDENNEKLLGTDGKPILQFVSVQRVDNGEWALPGGMVNPGEERTATLIREFGEEALNSLEATGEDKEKIVQMMDRCFKNGEPIYEGYVDDPRNTDNAWMETKAINFHDNVGDGLGAFQLNAGDDAKSAVWMDIDKDLRLYASHREFIKKTIALRKASWSGPIKDRQQQS